MRKNNLLKKLVIKLANALDLTNELTPEEKVEFIKTEFNKSSLLERIKAIRNNSDFVPDYNKPKSFTDVVIEYKPHPLSDFVPISYDTNLIERPQDFGNDIMAWKDAVHIQYSENIIKQKIEHEQKENLKKALEYSLHPFIMSRMMEQN